jgi:hypothetical protein
MIEFTSTRFRCEHCGKTLASRSRMRRHEATCAHDPAQRSCLTCNLFARPIHRTVSCAMTVKLRDAPMDTRSSSPSRETARIGSPRPRAGRCGMTDRPINLRATEVRAALDGRKTQHRVVLKPQPFASGYHSGDVRLERQRADNPGDPIACRFSATAVGSDAILEQVIDLRFAPGDRLWVRETHALVPETAYRCSVGVFQTVNPRGQHEACIYREGFDRCAPRWRPSIHMPRWASRLTILVEAVRVERLQDISEDDAIAEGAERATFEEAIDFGLPDGHKAGFALLWVRLHGPDAWAFNPWVCAITFKAVAQNINQIEVSP